MKAVITGANGTIGSVLRSTLESQGHTVVAWDRQLVPIYDYHQMQGFLRDEKPDALFHLATPSTLTGQDNESWYVNYEWTSELAWITRILNIRFLFTSSVMVFTENNPGPYTFCSEPDADVGYGYEKRMAERRALYQNPKAVVARLGWQIGDKTGTNNMVDFIHKEMKKEGVLRASKGWMPACSFLEDTVLTLIRLIDAKPDIYMVDSNKHWNFYQIVQALNDDIYRGKWKVLPTTHFDYDQRMLDERVNIAPLSARLPSLN